MAVWGNSQPPSRASNKPLISGASRAHLALAPTQLDKARRVLFLGGNGTLQSRLQMHLRFQRPVSRSVLRFIAAVGALNLTGSALGAQVPALTKAQRDS